MKPAQPKIGMIISRTCPTCGHHEIGYVDHENTFHRLKAGDMVQVLEGDTIQNLDPATSKMDMTPDSTALSEAVFADLVAWAPEPIKSDRTLRLKYGVLVDREMAAGDMSPGLYGIAYRQKLHRLISEEKYAPLPVIFASFFGVPQLATGTPAQMTEALIEELDEVRMPIEWVGNWLSRKDEESVKSFAPSKSFSELGEASVSDEQFKKELEQLTLEEFFEML
ncbi:MAG: hypothetical protein V2B19_26870 [Pseudomonadota bacterium]